jgi:biopolymer transport protein ExbD
MVRLPKWLVVALALVLIVGLATPVLAAETKGKIKSVSADKNQFVFTDQDGKEWTFDVDKDAKIRLADKALKLDELKAGDEATVTYEKQGDKLIAKEVRCEKK